MHDLILNRLKIPNSVHLICIDNCDKDGAIVSTRIASALGGISYNPAIHKHPDRFTDKNYFKDILSQLIGYYDLVKDSKLIDKKTLVLSSVHRVAL